MIDPETITEMAESNGLVVRGGFDVEPGDEVPDINDDIPGLSLVLFGNAGSSLWESFSSSREYRDGRPDSLNRWSERIGNRMAAEFGGRAYFPFGGPPYQPFIRWASKAESLHSSKIGMLIHPQYGLWHAYRFAIVFPELLPGLSRAPYGDDICLNCPDQPCLKSCPVDAFTESGYDVERCFSYLDSDAESSCHSDGCNARLACPEGHSFRYRQDHAQFHMEAFYSSIKNRLDP